MEAPVRPPDPTNQHSEAPLERASIPTEPVPAKRSKTLTPVRSPKMLKMAPFTLSVAGRTFRVEGAESFKPLAFPEMTRMKMFPQKPYVGARRCLARGDPSGRPYKGEWRIGSKILRHLRQADEIKISPEADQRDTVHDQADQAQDPT